MIGSALPITFHPSSDPRARPGRTVARVDGCAAPAYIFRAESICAGVRHADWSWPEAAEQARAPGSNVQAPGFSITPSVTPSRASQAARAARLMTGYFEGGITLAGVAFTARFIAMRPAWR